MDFAAEAMPNRHFDPVHVVEEVGRLLIHILRQRTDIIRPPRRLLTLNGRAPGRYSQDSHLSSPSLFSRILVPVELRTFLVVPSWQVTTLFEMTASFPPSRRMAVPVCVST